jgi:hypothetical protein
MLQVLYATLKNRPLPKARVLIEDRFVAVFPCGGGKIFPVISSLARGIDSLQVHTVHSLAYLHPSDQIGQLWRLLEVMTVIIIFPQNLL